MAAKKTVKKKHVGKRKKVSKTKKKYPKRDSKGRFTSSKKSTKKHLPKSKLKKTKRRDSKTQQRVKSKLKPKRKVVKKKSRKVIKKKPLKLVRKFFKVEPYRVKFFRVEKASADGYDVGGDPSRESYMGASHGNTSDLEKSLPIVFEKAFIGAARKTGYFDDIEDIYIYRFGIIIRPRSGVLTDRFKQRISDILQVIPGISIHHVIEDEKTFSIRINLGSPIQGILSGVVSDELKKYKSVLADVYSEFRSEYSGGVEWYTFWDTEENMISH